MQYNLGTARGSIEVDDRGLQAAEVGLRQAGLALTGAGTAMVGAVGYVIKTSADFEKSMSTVSAVTGETGANLDKLREQALELGKQGPYGPKQVAEAFIELTKAGLTTQQILDGVGQATVVLASAGDLALARSGEILANTLVTYQLSADKAGHVADVLAGAANASTVDVEDLAVSLKYAGSVAAAVGISFEETAQALTILGNAGIKGSTAGTSLRRILLNIQPASKPAEAALRDLGIITEDGANRFFTAEGKAKSLAEIMQILKDSTDGLTDAQKLQAVNQIFGARAAASVLLLMRDGAQAFADAEDMISRTTATEVAEKKLDNLAGSITKLKAAIEAVFIEAGSPFQNVLKNIVNGLRELVLWFGNIPQPIQTAILVIVAVIGVLALLAGGAFLVLAPILSLIHLMAILPANLAMARTAITGITTAVRLFTASLLTNPVFLIIAALVALAAALVYLYFKWEPFRNFVDGLWQSIQKIWDSILDFFQNLPQKLGDAYEKVKEVLGKTFDFIKEEWDTLLAFLVNPVYGTIKFVTDRPEEGGPTRAEQIGGGVKEFADREVPKAQEAVNNLRSNIETSFPIMRAQVEGAMTGASTAVRTWAESLVETGSAKAREYVDSWSTIINEMPGKIGYALGFMAGTSLRIMSEWVQTSITKTREMVDGVIMWVAQLPNMVGTWMLSTLSTINNNMGAWTITAWSWASNMVNGIIMWVAQLPNRLGQIMISVLSWVQTTGVRIVGAAWSIGSGIYTGVLGFLSDMPDKINGIFLKVVDVIKGLISRAAKAAREFASGIWRGIKDGLEIHSPSNVEEAFFAMDSNVTKSLAHMLGEVKALNSLKSLQGSLAFASTPTSLGSVRPDSSLAANNAGPSTYLDLTINNPVGETTDESVHRTLQRVAVHGLLPPVTEESNSG